MSMQLNDAALPAAATTLDALFSHYDQVSRLSLTCHASPIKPQRILAVHGSTGAPTYPMDIINPHNDGSREAARVFRAAADPSYRPVTGTPGSVSSASTGTAPGRS